MEVKADKYDVGVIVGRFQVPELHDAHMELIQHVCEQHDKVLLFLGLSPIVGTRENPLDFEARRQMVSETFPEVNVLYIKDQAEDTAWSKRLDEQIEDNTTPSQTAVLYGGRDSFVAHYSGKHPTRELESERYVNAGTEIRKQISKSRARPSIDFRTGAVWQAYNQFPTAYTTVDIGVFDEDHNRILLVRKPLETGWRLIGGFSSPASESFEADARREVMEETHIDITDPEYVGSQLVQDWRYHGEVDQIKTLLFQARIRSGSPRPDDDIAEVKWFNLETLAMSDLVPNHRSLVATLELAVGRIHSER